MISWIEGYLQCLHELLVPMETRIQWRIYDFSGGRGMESRSKSIFGQNVALNITGNGSENINLARVDVSL